MPRLFSLLIVLLLAQPVCAATIQLKDGRTLSGDIGQVSGVAEDPTDPTPTAGAVKVTPILIVDDGLRRTFIAKNRVRDIIDEEAEKLIKIRLPWQNVADHGAMIGRVGRLVGVTPFDQYGRRIYTMQGKGGGISVVQGVTEVTPVYTRVRGLSVKPRSYVWDMRLATSSIPRETLSAILAGVTPQTDADARLQVVRLYLQSERYRDARRELEAIIQDFPQMEDLKDEVRQLRQLGARSILDEIELRRSAGQHELVRLYLEKFPSEEVAGSTLERVRELLDEMAKRDAQRQKVIDLLASVVDDITEPKAKQVAQEIQTEITAELNEASLPRMTAFLQLADGGNLKPEQKVALAISGWLLGTNSATENLPIALSLFDVRAKVREYLQTTEPQERDRLTIEIRDSEGGSVDRVAQILKNMKPPLPVPPEASEATTGEGVYEFTIPVGVGDSTVRYVVQLPPEYDPLRKYPTIVSLHGIGYRPETQLDYWAGPLLGKATKDATGKKTEKKNEKATRRGQAMRHGYIVIAPAWQQPQQFEYNYTAREHAAVLAPLRDAMRRFSIDTDRVYLTGHDIGGDAAWDIALAHPDHWAGVMPFLATARKYVGFYEENAKFLPWYVVAGEMDGGKMERNSRELDRYLRKGGYDATVVEFLGRGHEAFSDEIQRLFDWMDRKVRSAAAEEFEVDSMRPWDNYFWWLEFNDLPAKSMVPPANWTERAPPGRARAVGLRGRRYVNNNQGTNKLGAWASAGRTTFWLSPDVVDFDKPITLELNGRAVTTRDKQVEKDLSVLLEDARVRGERLRPFWAKFTVP